MKQLKIYFKFNLWLITLVGLISILFIFVILLEVQQFSTLYISTLSYPIYAINSKIVLFNTELVKEITSSELIPSTLKISLDTEASTNSVITLCSPQTSSNIYSTQYTEEVNSSSNILVNETKKNASTSSEISDFPYSISGKICIPKTHIDYPIVSSAHYKAMELSPCILYSTGILNYSGNTLIIAHNYQNNTLFSNNYQLEIGDTIQITSLDGITLSYIIYEKYVTTPEDASFMERSISNKPEISLSTCTNDEENRLIILAKAE